MSAAASGWTRPWAAPLPTLSRSQIQRLIKEAYVTVEGRVAKPSTRLEPGDHVIVRLPPPQPTALVAEAIPLDIVYEDADILVVNKPAGMVVHPAHGHASGTLVNAVLAHCPELEGVGGEQRPGIVHRLDKDTSGLIVIAKNDRAHRELQRQFKAREVTKAYLALVEGRVSPQRGIIEAPIGRDPVHRQRMAVVRNGREAFAGRREDVNVPGVSAGGGRAGDRAHPSDPAASGLYRPPGGGRPRLWPP